MYLRSVFLAILANQAIRKISKLRAINTHPDSESLPLRQIPDKSFQFRTLREVLAIHYITALGMTMDCFGVTLVSVKAASNFCIAAFD